MTADVTTPPANAPRSWDFMLTGLFIFFELLLLVVLFVSALSFGAINSGCQTASTACNATGVQFGQLICTFAPPVIALVTIPLAIVRVLRRRIAFWVALLGCVLMSAAFLLGTTLMALPVQ